MAQRAHPAWIRILEIVIGIIVLVLAGYLIFNPNVAINLLRIILGVGLVVLGLVEIIRGATSKVAGRWGRVLTIVLGIIVLLLGVAAIVDTSFGAALLVTVFALGLLLNAIGRIEYAGYATGIGLPGWVRGASFALGIIALIIAILVIVFPTIVGFSLLVILVALALLLLGIELILSGAAG
ncbi:MAG TPA: DUF308 domain-containing protein [Candidatus Bathyarchaeia archaeon]|nr:DUF308 domain-containing protein [Candidatus Bathyarchaeia archaeon]